MAVFTPEGTTGTFIHPTGASCDITSSTGYIELPSLWDLYRNGNPPFSTASGSVMFDCESSDGTALKLDGEFTIPLSTWTLPC